MADITISKFTTQVVRTGSTPSSSGFAVNEGQDPVNPSGTGNFVPYSGATDNVELGEFGIEAGFVQLDTTPTNTPTTQGSIYWDEDDETIAVILNGTIMKIGEDQFYPVKNQTGSTIAKGTAVRFAGTVGASGRLLIAPFIADNSVPSSRFMGVTSEAILNGADGKVMWFGRIRGINTNAFNEGDILYASTTTAGGFQTTIPVAPNNIVQVAAVVTKSINNGTIFVRPTLGSNINKDEGVKIVSPTTGQLLQLQANGLWENKTKAQVLAGTSSQFVKGDGSLDSTAYVSSVTASSPLASSGGATPNITIQQASGSQNGFLSSTDWTTFNNKTSNVGTVTSVAALTLGTTGTDLSSSVANGTTTPVITLNVPTASAANRGALSAADWTTFNGKENAITAGTTAQYYRGDKTFQTLNTAAVPELTNLYYTEARVNANANVAANTAARHNAVTLGTANGLSLSTQQLSLGLASSSANGALSSTDWTSFNNKQNALTNPVTGTGTTNFLPKFTGASTIGNSIVSESGAVLTIGGAITANVPTDNTTVAIFHAGGGTANRGLRISTFSSVNDNAGVRLDAQTTSGGATLIFATGGTDRMRINSSGNLGLGVTPSAWSGKSMQIVNSSLTDVASSLQLSYNGYFDGSNWRYITSAAATNYYQTDGAHIWRIAPSGTAGNAISFTQAMTLGSNSGLSIGTPSAAPSQGLLVQGNVGIGASPVSKFEISSFANTYLTAPAITLTDTSGDANSNRWIIGNIATDYGSFNIASAPSPTSTTFTPRLTILRGGNVGIGTTSPTDTIGYGRALDIQSSTGAVVYLRDSDAPTTQYGFIAYDGNDNGLKLNNENSSGFIRFNTAGSERMRITSGGNVLIGTATNGASKLRISGLPTSAVGLSSGDVYNMAGVLMIA
jgi:hypothetical protein